MHVIERAADEDIDGLPGSGHKLKDMLFLE
jgi:hypothetical protein